LRLKHLVSCPIVAGLNLPADIGEQDWPRYIRTTDIVGPESLADDVVRVAPEVVGGLDVRTGDVLFTRTGSLGTTYLHTGAEPAAFAGYLVRVRPDLSRVDPRWLGYTARSAVCQRQIAEGAIRSTIDNFNATKVGNLEVPDMPLSTQQLVADFLDRECRRIDEAIDVTRLVVRGVEECRTDAVRRAVEGLHTGPLKYGFSVVDCKHRTPEYVIDGYPVISTREVRPGGLDLTSVDRFVGQMDYEDMREGGRDPRLGDIIYSRNASIGVAAYVSQEADVCMGQDVVLITRRPNDCELLAYVLNHAVADQIDRLSVGSTFSRINVPVIRSLVVPYDTLALEAQAVELIRGRFAVLDQTEGQLQGLIGELGEYREALITEAVTGQLDVVGLSDARMSEGLHAVQQGEQPEVLAS
jgi:type I restriction enzyme, S subunit